MPRMQRRAFLALSLAAAAVPSSFRAASAQPAPADGVAAEVEALRAAMAAEVPSQGADPRDAAGWEALARGVLARSSYAVDAPQMVVVVDRAVAVQRMVLMVAVPGGPWSLVGGGRVSTGKPGRKDHYVTPTGVFLHTDRILGFRAQGTYNENRIRGYGARGMRVWDFGWQRTEHWRWPGTETDLRLAMHATDPAVLEPRLGRPDSAGCVRVAAAMNRFLDRRAALDADYLRAAAAGERRFAALLPRDGQPSSLAGRAMVVVDSSLPA